MTSAAQTNTDRSRRPSWMIVAVVVVAGLVLGAAVAVVVVKLTSSDAAALTMEPADMAGDDPFTASAATGPVAFAPNAQEATAATRATFTADPQTGALVAPASTPGLYGGSGDVHVCDPQQIVDFLATEPAKAQAWASVFGISTDDIGSYVASLTPVLLTSDTLVTNHGYHNGEATSLQSVLQTGTAVLVDSTGAPRVKCNCGNPLTSPEAISLSTAELTGTAWPGYSVNNFTIVHTTTQITTFVLINVQTGTTYQQPAGTPSGGTWVAAVDDLDAGGSFLYASDDGQTWNKVYDAANPVTALVHAPDGWDALSTDWYGKGQRTTHLLRSQDGKSWTDAGAIATDTPISGLAYGDGTWLGAGVPDVGPNAPSSPVPTGTTVPIELYKSSDLTTWTKAGEADLFTTEEPVGSIFGVDPSALAYGDGRWTMLATAQFEDADYWSVATSSDGSAWQSVSSNANAQQSSGDGLEAYTYQNGALSRGGIAYGNGTWALAGTAIAQGTFSAVTATSPDLSSWQTNQVSTNDVSLLSLSFSSDNKWYALGQAETPGNIKNPRAPLFVSTDGLHYDPLASQLPSNATLVVRS